VHWGSVTSNLCRFEVFCCTRQVLSCQGEGYRPYDGSISCGDLTTRSTQFAGIPVPVISDILPRPSCRVVDGKKAPNCDDNRDGCSCTGTSLLRRGRKLGWRWRWRRESRYSAGHLQHYSIRSEWEHYPHHHDYPQGNLTARGEFRVLSVLPQHVARVEHGGQAGSQTRICSFGRYRVVLLHHPPIWNSRRESNPDLFVRTEASSCFRPREPN
jgi:hypothetical protein